MLRETRIKFNAYRERIAELNNISPEETSSKFSVVPAVAQTMEQQIQESSAFLQQINNYTVVAQEGEKIGVGVGGMIASRTNTNNADRQTKDVLSLNADGYRCEQTNFDTHIRYETLDAWAQHPEFQNLITRSILEKIALNRICIGFNGTSVSKDTNQTTSPLLEDVNIGWLEKIRQRAPERYMFEIVDGSGKIGIGESEEYKNLDALVEDAKNNLLDPWAVEDPSIVVLVGSKLMQDKYFPLVNNYNEPTEKLATDLIISQKRIGGLSAVRAPFMPQGSFLITSLKNLSIYNQKDSHRRMIRENPARDRVETFQSMNESYVVEDYGYSALIDNIELVV